MFHKENFQYQKGDLIKVIKSVIMMIMMKNIKKMDVWEIKQMEIYIILNLFMEKIQKNKRKFKA